MRVLICGGRDPSKDTIEAVKNYVRCQLTRGDVLINGCARGVDSIAMYEAALIGDVVVQPFPAYWSREGKAAGFIRNQRMLDEGKPDIVVAFKGGRGTADMVARAIKAGVTVMRME